MERWLPINDYEGLYEVSNCGRVRSVERVVPHKRSGLLTLKGKMLKFWPDKGGHLQVGLCQERKVTRFFVHHLVLEAFVGPRPAGMECRHFPDVDPSNNKLENLCWGTREENMADRVPQGNSNQGNRHPLSKLTDKDVLVMRSEYKRGTTTKELAKRFNVAVNTAYYAITGRNWKHLPLKGKE